MAEALKQNNEPKTEKNNQKELIPNKEAKVETSPKAELSKEEQIGQINKNIEIQKTKIAHSLESIEQTKSSLNAVREKLGLPLKEEEPLSIALEKDRVKRLQNELEGLEKQREELIKAEKKEPLELNVNEIKKYLIENGVFESVDEYIETVGKKFVENMNSLVWARNNNLFSEQSLATDLTEAVPKNYERISGNVKEYLEAIKNNKDIEEKETRLSRSVLRTCVHLDRVKEQLEKQGAIILDKAPLKSGANLEIPSAKEMIEALHDLGMSSKINNTEHLKMIVALTKDIPFQAANKADTAFLKAKDELKRKIEEMKKDPTKTEEEIKQFEKKEEETLEKAKNEEEARLIKVLQNEQLQKLAQMGIGEKEIKSANKAAVNFGLTVALLQQK